MALLGGRYELGERLGGGGMAEVFRASLRGVEGFRREVAVKRMRRSLSTDPSFGKMFVNEARVASRLSHPNIAAVLDFDRADDGRYYLVMELVPGVDLRKIAATGPVSVEVAVYVVGEILRGLDSAHRLVVDGKLSSVVHRDISPHNVMVSWDGGVKIVDFGIAKALAATAVSRSGSLKGKAAYMSPEQAHGQELDGRADLFATGVLFHELLTTRRLFRGDTEAETLSLMLTAPIPRPRELGAEVPEDVEAIAMQLVERDRERRPESARAALEALLDCSAYSPRARLDLERLLEERFPAVERGRAPTVDPLARTVASDSISVPSAPPARGTEPGVGGAAVPPSAGPTAAESPLARRPPLPSATLTAAESPAPPVLPVRTLTAAESTAPTPTPAPRPPRSRAPLWVALAAILTGAVAATVAALAGGDDEPAEVASAAPGDQASPEPVEPAASPSVDPAPTARPAEPTPAPPAEEGNAVDPPSEPATLPPEPAAPQPEPEPRRRPPEPEPRRERSEPGQPEPDPTSATAAADPGIVVVVVAGQWADVYVDGKRYGQAPARIRLPAGRHEVVIENPELNIRRRRTVRVTPGDEITVEFELR